MSGAVCTCLVVFGVADVTHLWAIAVLRVCCTGSVNGHTGVWLLLYRPQLFEVPCLGRMAVELALVWEHNPALGSIGAAGVGVTCSVGQSSAPAAFKGAAAAEMPNLGQLCLVAALAVD